jgi:5-methylcytosine-specific restriction endonuclease McrA
MSFWRANGIDPGKCWYCDAPAEHHDHFQPLVLDGAHTMDNLVPACGFHNLSKGGRDPWTFVRPFVLDVRAVHEEDGGVRIEIYRKVDARSP